MGTKRAVVSRIALAWIALVMACSDSPGTAAPDAHSDVQSSGRGTAACNEWQSAYCGLLVKCQSPEASALCEQVKAFSCKSDADAKQCADLINATGCAQPPAVCDIAGIADPAPAKKMCEDFNTAFCKRMDECDPGTFMTCQTSVNTNLDCNKVLGVTLAYEACMIEIPKIACTAMELPAVCKGVLLLGP
jgi:hypothetical protein